MTQAERSRRYREKHREEIRERRKAESQRYRETHPDANREWRKRNPDQRKIHTARYRDKHRDELRQKDRARAHTPKRIADAVKWRAAHREEAVERAAQWDRNHPEQARMLSRIGRSKRRAIEMQSEGAYTPEDVKRQLNAQHSKCYWCNQKISDAYHVDHVIPLSRGGSNGPENLVIACPHCNESKGAKLPHEWEGNGGKLL